MKGTIKQALIKIQMMELAYYSHQDPVFVVKGNGVSFCK